MPFAHLHNHTENSLLDGASRIKSVCQTAAAHGQTAMAITDHGSLAGAWSFTKAAKAAGIKPIVGMEAYFAIGSRFEQNSVTISRDDSSSGDAEDGSGAEKVKRYEHLTLIAKNETGWKNLLAIHNKAERTYWYKSRADYELLKEHGEGLIVLTGCLAGPIAGPLSRAASAGKALTAAKMAQVEAEQSGDDMAAALHEAEVHAHLAKVSQFEAEARTNLDTLIDCVGKNNIFLEIMYHGIESEKAVLRPIVALGQEYGIPLVATNDCHYEHEHDAETHDGFLAVGVKRSLDDPTRFAFNGGGYHVRSETEMRAVFPRNPEWQEAVSNSQLVADMCDDQVIPAPRMRLPKFPIPSGFENSDAYLYKLVLAGAKERYGSPLPQEVKDRLRHELDVISMMGFSDYFLIVSDVINWARSDYTPQDWIDLQAGRPTGEARARKAEIVVGLGRGSAAGSAVSYCLNIVGIDPLENKLLFERFLEPDRAGMPDIDVDFEAARRDEVFAYLGLRWGAGNVARIGTFGVALAKAAIKDAARILKPSGPDAEAVAEADALVAAGRKPEADALMKDASIAARKRASEIQGLGDRLASLVPDKFDLEKLEDPSEAAGDAFREAVAEAGEDAQTLLRFARGFEGLVKNESIHACGFIVSPEPLDELVPLRLSSHAANADPLAPRIICWDGPTCEDYGLLKMDVLGLSNLDIVAKALANIESTTGERITFDGIPHPNTEGDPKVAAAYELIGAGRTAGVFQMDGAGMKKVAQDVRPHNLTDISAIVALFRPGPLAAKVPERFAARKNGLEPIDYAQFTANPVEQEWIAKVLDDTYGLFCVAEGERVYSASRGLMVPIEDLNVGELVQGVDPDGRHVLAPITAHALTGHRQVFRVALADGKSVRLTDDHPVLTQRGWVAVGNLREDDSIATPWKLLEDTDDGPQLDPNEGRLLGYLLGDGTLSSGPCGQFTNRDEGLHADFGECVTQVFPGYYARRVPNSIHSVIRGAVRQGGAGGSLPGKPLVWLRELGLVTGRVGLKSNSKHIPAKWLAATGDAAWSIVGALWDCDGRIGPRVAAYKTISRRLCDDLVYMLLRLGFVSSVTESPYTNPDGSREIAYHIGIVEPEKFKEAIRPFLRSAVKQTACDTHIKGQKRVNYTRGSLVNSAHIRELAAAAAGTVGRATRISGLPRASARTNKFVGHMMLEKLAAGTGSQGIAGLLGSRWVPVRSIAADGYSNVYDISVEGVSSFVAEGLVVHNCFQEQLMQLGTVIAGFDAKGRSKLRKAVGKKKKDLMEEVGAMLVEGSEKEFRDEDGTLISPVFAHKTAEDMFEQMKGSAEYLFNASHSAAYAQLAYITAYLKANWPVEYGAAILAVADKDEKRLTALQSLREDGITVAAPDLNRSRAHTAPVDGIVLIGLSEIKEVGSAGVHIVAERDANGPFASLHDLLSRVRIPNPETGSTRLSAGAVQGLIEAGALDELGPRLGLLMSARVATESETAPVQAEWSIVEEATRQRARIGVCLGVHPLTALTQELKDWKVPEQSTLQRNKMGKRPQGLHKVSDTDGSEFLAYGVIAQWEEKGYSGGRRANFAVESSKTTLNGVVWDNTLTQLRRSGSVPKVGDVVAVSGRVKVREVQVGDEEAGTVETITTKELNANGMVIVRFPSAPVMDLAPLFDFAAAYERVRALPTPSKARTGRASKQNPAPDEDGPLVEEATVTDLAEHRKAKPRRVVVEAPRHTSAAFEVVAGDEGIVPHLPVPPKDLRRAGECLRFVLESMEFIVIVEGGPFGPAEMLETVDRVPADSPRWRTAEAGKSGGTWSRLAADQAHDSAARAA